MATVARVKKDGTLLLKDTLNERLPVITNGLVAYYPLDSQAGAVDVIYGRGTNQNLESGINILDCLTANWRNPALWGGGFSWDETQQAFTTTASYGEAYFSNYIAIDTSKSYYLEADVKSLNGAATMYYGFRFYDANFSEIGTNQHYGTFDYTGCQQVIPTTWLHLKNTSIGGAAKTGEGDTGATVFHTGTKYVQILFLVNYYTTDQQWIKNVKLTTSNSNTSNCVLTNDGLGIEEATTNLVSSPDFASGWASYGNGNDGVCLTEFGKGLQLINRQSWCGTYKGITAPAGTYTLSVWVKLIGRTNSAVDVTLYTSGGGISDTAVSADWSKQGQWQRISMTRTYTANNYFTLYLICFGGSNAPAYKVSCIYAQPQIELRSFATSFINGNHSDSRLFLPVSSVLNNTTCTINFDYFKEYGVSNTLISGSIIQNSPPNGAWWGLYHDSNGAVYIHWLDGSSTAGFYTQTQYTWANYTICWDASYEYVYVDGVLKAQKAKSANLATSQLPTITLGFGWTQGNGRFKNFKVYNRTLSVNEIQKLAGESFKLDNTRATSLQFIETPTIPVDAYYYPLASDTKDVSKVVDAYTNTNVAYEDESIWVGTATTNVATSWTGSQRPNGVYLGLQSGVDCWKFTSGAWNSAWSGNSYGYMAAANFTQAAGTPYTFSFKEYISNDSNSIGFFDVEGTAGGYSGSQLSNTYRPKIIQRSYSSTFSSTANIVPYVYPLVIGNTTGVFSGYHLIWRPQVELKSFRSPVANMSRGATHLSYNFNSSIGLDWSGNWTICYWKKPIATHADNFTAYNIESFGCNSNSVGGSYMWWGKENGSNSLTFSLGGGFSGTWSSNYFGNWQFVSIVKTGTTITIKITGKDFYHTSSASPISLASNAFVTQYGYDFKLGGWDNGNPTNTYFRDLIVVKRALSDAELNNIYKQFRITKTSSNSSLLIEEGI